MFNRVNPVVFLIGPASLLAGCRTVEPVQAAPTPVAVSTVSAERLVDGAAAEAVRYSGSVLPDTQVDVAFKQPGYVSGIVQKVGADGRLRPLQAGDLIGRGQFLAGLRQAEYAAPVEQGVGQVMQSRAGVSEHEARLSAARSDEDGARKSLEEAEAARNQGLAGRRQAEAQLRSAEAAIQEAITGRAAARSQVEAAQGALGQAKEKHAQALEGVSQAEAAVKARQASEAEARLSFERTQRLFLAESATRPALEQTEAAYKVAHSAREQVEAQLAQARAQVAEAREGMLSARAQVETARAQLAGTDAKVDQARAGRDKAESAVAVADAQVVAAEARIGGARAALAGSTALVRGAGAGLHQARAQVHVARAALAGTRIPLSDTSITAPLDGVVVDRKIEVGSLVQPGAPAFSIADTARVKITFGVPDTVLPYLRMGAPQTVTADALPGRTFHGRITSISPSADPKTRVYTVQVSVANPARSLELGMVVSLQVRTAGSAAPRTLGVLPMAAVVSQSGDRGYAVFVPQRQGSRTVACRRRIELGPALSENRVAVTGGVRPGEVIITSGAMLHDGEEIQVQP